MLDKSLMQETEDQFLETVEKIKYSFLQDITKIVNENIVDFQKKMYQEYSKTLKKIQLENINEFQKSLKGKGEKSDNQFLIDVAEIVFKSANN